MRIISVVFVLLLTAAIATSALAACDAEWHQNGELPDWANVSFAESNNPAPKPRRKRQKAANRKKSDDRRQSHRTVKPPIDEEDDGFIRFLDD